MGTIAEMTTGWLTVGGLLSTTELLAGSREIIHHAPASRGDPGYLSVPQYTRGSLGGAGQAAWLLGLPVRLGSAGRV